VEARRRYDVGEGIGTVARLRTILNIGAKRTIADATDELEGTSGSLVSANDQAARPGLEGVINFSALYSAFC